MSKGMKLRSTADFWSRLYEKHRSASAFARCAGVSETVLRSLTDERHIFRVATAKKMAGALGAPLREVFEEAWE